MKRMIMIILPNILFSLLLFRVECIERNVLLSLKNDDFWPNEIISSTNGTYLELFTGLPYALKKGCDGSLIKEVVILPTLNANQYFIKSRGSLEWFGRRGQPVFGKRIADINTYHWEEDYNGEHINQMILANDAENNIENNRYFWTLDGKPSKFWGINSCLYTHEVVAHCGALVGIASKPKKVDGGYVAPYYNWCKIRSNININFGFKFEPLFDYPLQLESSIYDIKYETNLEKLIENYAKQHMTLLTKSTINNNSSAMLEKTVSNSRTLTNEFSYDFHDAWSNFHSVHVDIDATAQASVGLFGLFSGSVSASINAGYKYEHQQTTGWATKNSTSKSETYSVSRTVRVPPHTNIKVFAYVNFIEKMLIKVKLMLKITSTALRENLDNDVKKSFLDADVVEYLMKQRGVNSRIKIVGREKDAVLAELDGRIVASFGVDTVFNVEEGV